MTSPAGGIGRTGIVAWGGARRQSGGSDQTGAFWEMPEGFGRVAPTDRKSVGRDREVFRAVGLGAVIMNSADAIEVDRGRRPG